MSDFIEGYHQEAREILSRIEDTVLDIEQHPEDEEKINRLFREVHTLKGSSTMFGFDETADFLHHLENVLDQVRKKIVPVSAELVSLVLSYRDRIRLMLDNQEDEKSREARKKIVDALYRISGMKNPVGSDPEKMTTEPGRGRETTYQIQFEPYKDIIHSGLDPALILREIREKGSAIIRVNTRYVPLFPDLDPVMCYFSWDILFTTRLDLNGVKDIFIFVEDQCRLSIRIVDESDMGDMPLPMLGEILVERGDIRPEVIDETLGRRKKIGELLIDSGKVNEESVMAALEEQRMLNERKERALSGSLRVSSEKLDQLINLVGELVITQARLTRIAEDLENTELSGTSEVVERLVSELRDCTLDMRMMPIGIHFGEFRRLVRDLSRETGKEVRLEVRGAETELDKSVVEKLKDPIIHIIRNCVDHGIEPVALRKRMGKPNAGTISISASHKGPKVVITISDDGRGIDTKKINAVLVEKGIVPAGKISSEQEIIDRIFEPGFSTADEVTSISGRGVGMDVVKRGIDALGGSIRIQNEKGKGLSISMTIPLTMAILDGLLIRVNGKSFVLPLSRIEECVAHNRDESREKGQYDLLRLRDEPIPFLRLRDFFRMEGRAPDLEQIIIINADNYRFGLAVDEIVGNVQTIIKSLDRICRDAVGISGAAIMGDGSVALIADISAIIRCAEKEQRLGEYHGDLVEKD